MLAKVGARYVLTRLAWLSVCHRSLALLSQAKSFGERPKIEPPPWRWPFQFEFAGATNGDNFTQDAIQLFGLGIGSAGLGAGGHSPETADQILCPFLRLPLLWLHQVAA